MSKFSPSTPRKMYWAKDAGGCSKCPECGSGLESEHHSYVVAVPRQGETDTVVLGTGAGYFCENCPTIVLDSNEIGQMLEMGMDFPEDFQFAVLGLVDHEGVPEEKKHVAFGSEDNPLPLVKFKNYRDQDI